MKTLSFLNWTEKMSKYEQMTKEHTDLDSRKNKGDAFIMISHFRISRFWYSLAKNGRFLLFTPG